jgi:type IV secretion system protein VirB10
MEGGDHIGRAGFHDQVNNHYWRVFGTSVLMGLVSAVTQLSQPASGPFENNNIGETAAGSVGKELSNTSSQILRRNLRIQPTLEIRAGYKFNIQVNKDLIFAAPYGYQNEE